MPKIPSVRIPDLAAAMAPNLPTRVIGIRPGEKLHEIMCPTDDSHLTLRFHDHFVIKPTIKFFRKDVDYVTNQIGEHGEPVSDRISSITPAGTITSLMFPRSGNSTELRSNDPLRTPGHLALRTSTPSPRCCARTG